MSSIPHSRYQAALSIEELFQQPHHPHQNWLLTYLDVFVLIVMLVITLITLSDFETEQKEKAQRQQKQIKKLTPPKSSTIKQPFKKAPNNAIKFKKTSTNLAESLASKIAATEQLKQPQPLKQQVPKPSQTISKKNAVFENQKIEAALKNEQKQETLLTDDTLQKQLKKTVEQLGLTDSVDMKVTQGYAQLEIQDKILFKSSAASLLKAGEVLLKKLTPLLKKSSGLIYIEGHTDNRPIKTAKFPSNWELGAARATSVLHYLASQKLQASRLRAITYADTKPIADNTTKEGRGKNRRVSIVIKISDKID